jgi:UDP-2-acetamido-3-amino-2,3-dideoxy-glucuronate N-acetyltransferase
MILRGAIVGRNVTMGHNVNIYKGAIVGDGCNLQCNTDIYTGVELGEDVFIGPGAVFTNDLTPRAFASKHGEYVRTKVEKGASIGANATIVAGVTIGEYAAVGAGAVVTKDVEPYTLVVGNPAKPLRKIGKNNKWTKEDI